MDCEALPGYRTLQGESAVNMLYLASGSPRRRELLTQIGVPFTVVSALLWPWVSYGLRGLRLRLKIN